MSTDLIRDTRRNTTMAKVEIGSKLYSYVFGPMTVKSINTTGEYVTVKCDHPEKWSDQLKDYQVDSDTKDFYIASIGHWVFETEEEAKSLKVDNDFDRAYCNVDAIESKPELAYEDYR